MVMSDTKGEGEIKKVESTAVSSQRLPETNFSSTDLHIVKVFAWLELPESLWVTLFEPRCKAGNAHIYCLCYVQNSISQRSKNTIFKIAMHASVTSDD